MAGEVDYLAIADAIAARYTGVTPPTNESPLALASFDAPDQLGPTPALLVWPNDEEIAWETGGRFVAHAQFTARIYFERINTFGYRMRRLTRWRSVLYRRVIERVSLGITPPPLIDAELVRATTGEATYAEIPYDVIDLIHDVRIENQEAPGV